MSRPENTEAVYTLADLAAWRDDAPDAVSLAVLGHPIVHSASPAMHNAALATLARDDARFAAWRYYKFDIAPEALADALALLYAKRFRGLNLTVPLKVDVLRLLGDRRASAVVRAVGAANTLIAGDDAHDWRLENTDVDGLEAGVRDALKTSLRARPVVVLGTGGAARAAVVCAQREHAAAIQARSRDAARAARFAAEMSAAGAVAVRGIARDAELPQNALVVNATPLGLRETDAAPIAEARLRPDVAVYDMTYAKTPSALARACAARGAAYANGLAMLAAQGALSLSLWAGRPADAALMRAAALNRLSAL